jgi:ATP-dependent helicase Lhr and Lhr-like helicase
MKYKDKPDSEEEIVKNLNPLVKKWFFNNFKELALAQKYTVKEIHDRNNVLVSAPTGSGKTLTAFVSIINELVNLAEAGNLKDQVYCTYISPLKALNNDIFHNLERPLKEIKELALEEGKELDIRVLVRTGDTTPYEKQKMLKTPPHILCTTPESLAIVLSSMKFSEHLKEMWWIVLDEVHAIAENKRGVHLSLSLERLNALSNFTRIGLSATVAPLEKVAEYLVGTDRDCTIIDIQHSKEVDIQVISPVKDLVNVSYEHRNDALYTKMHKMIQEHKTTLVFTNTRAATERVVHALRDRYPSFYKENQGTEESYDLIGAHHGSLSKEHRLGIEQDLRDGKLRCAVCSTSLELGIDIGSIDLVILLGSPKSVARALQRAGRSNHALGGVAKGRIIVLDRDDLVECSLILKEGMEKKIDKIHIPRNCLDVLAQQIYGAAISDVWDLDELYSLIRKSYCYSTLSRSDFDQIINYLSGEYVALADRYIFAKIWKNENKIGKRSRMARMLYMTNIGTIPDQTGVKVKIGPQLIGSIGEGFLESLKPGDIFVLGGNTYQFRFSRGTVAQVAAAHGRLPTVPSWVSEMLPLSFDLSTAIQRFRKLMNDKFESGMGKNEIKEFIHDYLYVDDNAAESIYIYFKEQYYYALIPHEKRILLETYKEEKDGRTKTYHVFHALYGRRVNDVLSRAVAYAIGRQQKKDVRVTITDNGFVLTCDSLINPMKAFGLLKSEELKQVMKLALDKSEILLRRFRHCASRSLMILRNYKGTRKSVGRQAVSSRILMSAVRRISDNFPILKEARREVLEDKMDIDNAIKVLQLIEEGRIRIEEIQTNIPSPFAFNLALSGYSDILKMEDKIEFVKRMHQMVLARISLEAARKKSKAPIPYDF